MRYSVLNGGKRIRPLLTLATCHMVGADEREGIIPACAVELVHCYSLIHDDLPCLDNDETRRSKPTCHKKFGEAVALLAGDALLTLAFGVVAEMKDASKAHRILQELAHAAGTSGMVGGQVLEMMAGQEEMTLPILESIHIQKTGQLIKTSCLAGAVAGASDATQQAKVIKFGEYLGFAFQIVDDILDGNGYLRFMGAHEAGEKAAELVASAKREIAAFGNYEKLDKIADFVLTRLR